MFTALLVGSFAMMLYGMLRMAVADFKHQTNARVHALWIPGGALFFALGVAALTRL